MRATVAAPRLETTLIPPGNICSEPQRRAPEAQRTSSAGQVAPRKALFARRSDAVVEVIVNRAPDDRDAVFVRSTRGVDLEAVPAASLALIGFLPIDEG